MPELSLTLTCPTRRSASTLSTAWTFCWRPWRKQERPFPTSAPSSEGLDPEPMMDQREQDADPLLPSRETWGLAVLLSDGCS
ncbi:copper transport protein ATOX1 isoform X2 [Canis lupus baileyi]|uniref:copper transport protein ATOX1 isoform X2 n=1 Tax=Canis lupus baileyi TaxID=143281 RepID=UPI003B96E9DC